MGAIVYLKYTKIIHLLHPRRPVRIVQKTNMSVLVSISVPNTVLGFCGIFVGWMDGRME